jgi:hypothetical protein
MALGVQIATFNFVGAAVLNEIFGYFRAASSVQIQRVQISAQQAPVGGNITITLVNQNGVSLGASAVLASGTNAADIQLSTTITLGPGAVVRAKITGIDSANIGGFLTVSLIGATSQGSSGGPSGCCSDDRCLPPSAQLLFFPGTKGDTGPAGPASTVPGPDGPVGPDGAVGVYRGSFLSTTAYYSMQERKDIVAYAGHYYLARNEDKSGTATWEPPNISAVDWKDIGTSLSMVATEIQLTVPADIAVGLNLVTPGYLKSNNFVQGVSGSLFSWNGRLESYDAQISGLVSTNSPRFNVASTTRTMPAIGYAAYPIPPLADGDIPVNPAINYVTDDSLIFFGWLQGANNFLENRFGNVSQKFNINLKGVGSNTSAGSDLLYVQIYYRIRSSGGAWGGWNQVGDDVYVQKLAILNQSFQNIEPLAITLAGNNDIQFSAGFSKGVGGTAAIGAAKISVLALN